MIDSVYGALPATMGYGVGATSPQATPTNDKPQTIGAYQWVVAWVVVIILCAAFAQTDIGYRVIYYALVLILVLLLVTQYKFIATALAPIGTPVASNQA